MRRSALATALLSLALPATAAAQTPPPAPTPAPTPIPDVKLSSSAQDRMEGSRPAVFAGQSDPLTWRHAAYLDV